ncbi:FecR family protein [Sphingobacterium sp. SYP-B4668]|uniref:FecR family protein n=1 Tax=Sphingobacterium sp. SYP-B4668 TaxID=2996035 RepID=UPI0022DD792B|nr:FecR family protein [Sphingobacterium sp. SYP-B4668]
MMDNGKYIIKLARKYALRNITTTELAILKEWAAQKQSNANLLNEIGNAADLDNALATYHDLQQQSAQGQNLTFEKVTDKIQENIQSTKARKVKRLTYSIIGIAATFLLFFLGTLILFQEKSIIEPVPVVYTNNRNSNLVYFGTAPENQLHSLDQSEHYYLRNRQILDSTGSVLADFRSNPSNTDILVYVPKGSKIHLHTADGSTIFVNADSRLKLQLDFDELSREVFLQGEAYFDIAHDPGRPFYVRSKMQDVKVLGTRFNVKAYEDLSTTITALIEGSVRLQSKDRRAQKVMVPGETVVMQKSISAYTSKITLHEQTSWMQDELQFNQTSFEDAIKQISRAFDLDYEFKGSIPKEKFTGQLSTKAELAVVVDFFKSSGISCTFQHGILYIE